MIKRYTKPEMAAIWNEDNKFQKWLDVELAACKAHVVLGNIPEKDYQSIKENAAFDSQRISEIELEVQHDVIAFLTCLAEKIGPSSRFVHLGLTSSDVVDTAFSLQIKEATLLVLSRIESLMEEIKKQAFSHQNTLMMGRTHGVHAEPTTFGLKLAVWYEEWKRNKEKLKAALLQINVGKISGAVGNYAHMPPSLEALVCEYLNLEPANASTQILQRDRHAYVMTTLSILAGTLEKMATEIRALQKTEFNEILEPFSSQQKGSSAMPHKRNPIICERITGLARVIRGYALVAMENQNLWHERDISHSCAERIIFPDAFIALHYMLSLMENIIKNMKINTQQMEENIKKSYLVFFSQPLLLKLIEKGMLREDAYKIIQKNALYAFDHHLLFSEEIQKDPDIQSKLSHEEIQSLISYAPYLQHTQIIFERVFK